MSYRLLSALLILPFLFGASAHAEDAYSIMSKESRFRTWTSMIQAADLEGYARGSRQYTIFAVLEDSLQNIDPALMKAIGPQTTGRGADFSQLTFVVQSHVVLGLQPMSGFAGKRTVFRTVNGREVVVDATKTPVSVTFVGSQGVIMGDPVVADNAIIYPVLIKSAHFVRQ